MQRLKTVVETGTSLARARSPVSMYAEDTSPISRNAFERKNMLDATEPPWRACDVVPTVDEPEPAASSSDP